MDEVSCNFNDTLVTQTDSVKVLHGAVVAIIFFTVSSEARWRWYSLLSQPRTALTTSPQLLESAVSILESSVEAFRDSEMLDDTALLKELQRESDNLDARGLSVAMSNENSKLSSTIKSPVVFVDELVRDSSSFSHPRLDGL